MRNKNLALALLVTCFYFGTSEAASRPRMQRIYENLRQRVDSAELPGAVFLLAHKGEVVGLEAIGVSDLESKIPMKTDSIFRLASATKIITAVALLILYEDGKFALTDPVADYLPELKELSVYGSSGKPEPAKHKMRIRDLLRHTSGYGYGFADPQQQAYREAGILRPGPKLDWRHDMSLDQWIKQLSKVPLAEEPGTKFNYGLSSDIVGLLIERISSVSLDRWMQDRIFTPLRMEGTGFVVPEAKRSRLTSIYEIEGGKITALDRGVNSPFLSRPKALSGGGGWDNLGNGGLVSTASDLFRFLQMLLNHGELDGVRILSRKTVELIQQNHLSGLNSADSIWPGVGFGFGFAVLYDLSKYGEVGSPGTIWWAGSTNVHYWMDPQEELIGILMVQVRPFPYLDLLDDVRNMTFHVLD